MLSDQQNIEKEGSYFPLFLFDGKCSLCVRFKESCLRAQGHKDKIFFSDFHDDSLYQKFYQLLKFLEKRFLTTFLTNY